jgi:hypothetical protein
VAGEAGARAHAKWRRQPDAAAAVGSVRQVTGRVDAAAADPPPPSLHLSNG